MSKSIPLSPKHGLNPSIKACTWCGKPANDIVITKETASRLKLPEDHNTILMEDTAFERLFGKQFRK